MSLTINSDKTNVQLLEELNYEIILNNGDAKQSLTNIKFLLKVPEGIEIMDMKVEDEAVAFKKASEDSITIAKDLAPGEEAKVLAKVRAVAQPETNPFKAKTRATFIKGAEAEILEEEAEEVLVDNPVLKLTKKASVDEVVVGEIVQYSITVSNSGNVDFDTVEVIDILNQYLEFVDGSLKINGIPYPDESILSGVTLEDGLNVNQQAVITFDAEVTGLVDKLVNTVSGNYSYVTGKGTTITGNADSVQESIPMLNVSSNIQKLAFPSNTPLMLGDTIQYRVAVDNNGKQELLNVRFKDMLPFGVVLDPNQITVADQTTTFVVNNPDLEAGVLLGNLNTGERFVVTYTVRVTSGTCSGFIINEAFAEYNFKYKNRPLGNGSTKRVSTASAVGITNFSQMSIDKYCKIPCVKPDMEEVNDINVKSEMTNSYVIKTYKGTSDEGQKLTGYKLIINAMLNVSIEYTADLDMQPIHSYHCQIPISTFIILPEDYKEGMGIEEKIFIEDVTVQMADKRGAYINIVYMAMAKIC